MKIPKQIISISFVFMATLFSCNPGRHGTKGSQESPGTSSGNDNFFSNLLKSDPFLSDSILNKKNILRLQIIYSQIDRDKYGKPNFTDHYFNVDSGTYFYPASTVKLPVALLALQKLQELNIPGLDRNSTMITEAAYSGQTVVYNDPTTQDGRPTIANYIKKIFLASDNDAYNRLYEFLGQEYINNSLHRMGYEDAQIIHRLEISMSEDQNRHTNPVRFFDKSGKLIYEKAGEASKLVYAHRNTQLGKGYYKGNRLINEPFDFSQKNRLSLADLHLILRSVIFPEQVSEKQRFHFSKDDYDFVRKYMSMLPHESKYPFYDTTDFPDTYVKFLLFGGAKKWPNNNIRIFNKPGDAYGFMLDIDYVVDFKNKIEFMVSAVIYSNSDDILNDDHYDYDTIALPFFRQLGQVIYNYELSRKKKHTPDLSLMKFNYKEQIP